MAQTLAPTIKVLENHETFYTTEDDSVNWKTPRSDLTSDNNSSTFVKKVVRSNSLLSSLKKNKRKISLFPKSKKKSSERQVGTTNFINTKNMAPPVSPDTSYTHSISDGSSKSKFDDSTISDVSVNVTKQEPLNDTTATSTPERAVNVVEHDALVTPSTSNKSNNKVVKVENKPDTKEKQPDFITTPVKVTTSVRRSSKTEDKATNRKPYMKATPPPPSKVTSSSEEKKPLDDDTNELPESKRVFGLPSPRDNDILRDRLAEKREDSISAVTGKQQEQRLELAQKRRLEKVKEPNSEIINTASAVPPPAAATTTTNKIFSVEPLFPEHKRNLEETTESDGVHLKKPRVTGIEEKNYFGCLPNIPDWAKVAIPVVAIVAMIAINAIRKK